MTQIESPKRKMQKKNDYQRHKLFRKIKRRRKAQAEAEQQIAVKQLRKKLKLPKFGDGKTREVYTSDIHFNNDDAAGGVDRYGNKFDYVELPETVVTARKIPTFKDIEKKIGRKITQGEIDKVIAVDPQIPIQVAQPIEKGMYSPSVTNELINTIVGTAGDVTNYLANKAGLSNLAPNEQFVETRDGDALFDLPGYGQAAKLSLYGLGRYGGKLGLKKLQKLAKQELLERQFALSNADKQLVKDIAYSKPEYDHELIISPSKKQKRLQLSQPTYQVYTGNKHKISEVIDDSGNVNLANLLKIQNEALSNVPGGILARHRLENPDWHKTDWNTFLHSRDAYQRALQAGYPKEALFPTLMHDAGKLWAGDGHGPYGASIVKQIFPDATDEQIMSIYQHMDKVPESAMGKLVKGADIAEDNPFRTFKSELDWSPKSWFQKRADKKWTKQDEDALISHLQEYLDIEKKAKQNGTWLKNKDGSTFDGDPRSWVQMQSDSFKKSYNDEILTHGEDAINDLFGDFYGDGVGAGIGDKVLWTSTNKLLGKTYGNDVFSLAALKNAKTNIVADAEGRPWLNVVQGKDTNNLVYPNLTNDNIVRINNVVDVGPNIKWSEIKDFRKNETVPEYLSRKYTGDDVVIGQDVSRKSIVGNNGDFNPIDKNIYRALIPLISTYGLYDINKYNYNSGKDIRIKPSKRGTFTKVAKQHGMSVQGFANKVLRNPSKYSAAIRKKANFAHNAACWKH